MIIQPANYDTTSEYLTALDEYFVGEGEVYINKLDYDLDRYCEQVDYFINTLGYQVKSDFADYVPTPGFEDYNPPAAQFNIFYYDGSLTTYADTTATYTAGDTVTFAVVGSQANVNIVYYEIEITISTAFNTAITQVATVTDDDNDADYSIVIPNDWIGDATVTSVVANTRQEPVYYALSESPYSAGTLTQEVAPGISGTLSDRVIGDIDADGLLTASDLLTAIGRTYDYRLRAFHHFSVEAQQTTYDPIQSFQYWNYKLIPTNEDYSWQTGSGGTVLSGERKSLEDLNITISWFEGNGTALGTTSFTLTAGQLNSDSEYEGELLLGAGGDPVSIFFMVTRALNEQTLQHPVINQPVSNQIFLSFDGFNQGDYVASFEPGDTRSFNTYVNSLLGTNTSPICWSYTDNDALQSRYKIQGYSTSDFSGDVIVEQEFSVSIPPSVGNSASLMHQKTVTIPDTYDRDLFWKPVWSYLRYSNLVYLQQLSDSPIDLPNIGNLSVSDIYYDPSDTSHQMTVSFTPDPGVTASDYEITLTAVDTQATGNPNLYTFANGVSLGSGPWSWTRGNFSTAPLDQIKINFSIALA